MGLDHFFRKDLVFCLEAAFSILEKSEPLEDSFTNTVHYLENTAFNIGQLLSIK